MLGYSSTSVRKESGVLPIALFENKIMECNVINLTPITYEQIGLAIISSTFIKQFNLFH